MALPSLAPVSDLEVRLGFSPGTLSGADLERAKANLEDASALIRAEAGTSWVDADGVTITAPAEVVTVCRTAALRTYRNPENHSGENVGDYGFQTMDTGVYLTKEERRIVVMAADGGAKFRTFDVGTPSAYGYPTVDPAIMTWGLE